MIRPATADDLPALAEIYDEAVRSSIATFETEPPGVSPWQARLDAGEHLLVAELDGRVVGGAYSSWFRPRPGYAPTREVSVYLADDARGQGVGRALYDDLLTRLDADGVHRTLAVIALPNPASVALHEACGFTRAGLLEQIGMKFGERIDVGIWARPHP